MRRSKIGQDDLVFLLKPNEKSYQFFNGFLYLRESVLFKILIVALVILMYLERFFFLVIIKKTQCNEFIPLMVAILISTIVFFFQTRSRGKNFRVRMHQLFIIQGFEKLPKVWVLCISVLDVCYSMTLFWSAPTLPFLVLTIQFQIFVPFYTLIGYLFFGVNF